MSLVGPESVRAANRPRRCTQSSPKKRLRTASSIGRSGPTKSASGCREGSAPISGMARARRASASDPIAEIHRAHPLVESVQPARVAVMLIGVSVSCCIPIVGTQQVIAQHPGVAQGKGKALPPSWIARRRRVADERHSIAERMIDPAMRAAECRQRAGLLYALEQRRVCACLLAAIKKSGHVSSPLKPRLRLIVVAQINPRAAVTLRYRRSPVALAQSCRCPGACLPPRERFRAGFRRSSSLPDHAVL